MPKFSFLCHLVWTYPLPSPLGQTLHQLLTSLEQTFLITKSTPFWKNFSDRRSLYRTMTAERFKLRIIAHISSCFHQTNSVKSDFCRSRGHRRGQTNILMTSRPRKRDPDYQIAKSLHIFWYPYWYCNMFLNFDHTRSNLISGGHVEIYKLHCYTFPKKVTIHIE